MPYFMASLPCQCTLIEEEKRKGKDGGLKEVVVVMGINQLFGAPMFGEGRGFFYVVFCGS